jgi:hypothetical protein
MPYSNNAADSRVNASGNTLNHPRRRLQGPQEPQTALCARYNDPYHNTSVAVSYFPSDEVKLRMAMFRVLDELLASGASSAASVRVQTVVKNREPELYHRVVEWQYRRRWQDFAANAGLFLFFYTEDELLPLAAETGDDDPKSYLASSELRIAFCPKTECLHADLMVASRMASFEEVALAAFREDADLAQKLVARVMSPENHLRGSAPRTSVCAKALAEWFPQLCAVSRRRLWFVAKRVLRCPSVVEGIQTIAREAKREQSSSRPPTPDDEEE